MPDRSAPLEVMAELTLEVTAPSGAFTRARVTADGAEIRVTADRPDVMFAAVDRADVGRAADLLAAAGLVVRVDGPAGPVATVGAGVRSPVGRVLAGSARVAPDPRATARIAAGTEAARLALAAVVVLVAVGGVVLSRSRAGR